MQRWYTVVIPTRQSGKWMSALLEHYRARSVAPILLIDARTTDDTRQIAAEYGAQCVEVKDFTFTEAIVPLVKDVVTTPWALFIHDDEIPSDALFERLDGPEPPAEAQSVAIPRRWAWYEPGQPLKFGRSDRWADRALHAGADHAWRLFRPQEVEYVPAMHSEGFYIDKWSRFSSDLYIVHFEWIIRTRAQREEKLRRYDEYRYGYGVFFEPLYLPERQPEGLIDYFLFETHDYDRLAEVYYSLREPDLKIPHHSLRTRVSGMKSRVPDNLGLNDLFKEPSDRRALGVHLEKEIRDTGLFYI